MSRHLPVEVIDTKARIVAFPPDPYPATDRSFELPPVLYGATVACYLGFLAVMATGLRTPGLIIPMAIFTIFIVLGFALPVVWTRMAPDNPSKAMSYTRLRRDGVSTFTGRVGARDVAVQVLVLPVLVLAWGVATVTIAAIVR